jgi:hypothetical protein
VDETAYCAQCWTLVRAVPKLRIIQVGSKICCRAVRFIPKLLLPDDDAAQLQVLDTT